MYSSNAKDLRFSHRHDDEHEKAEDRARQEIRQLPFPSLASSQHPPDVFPALYQLMDIDIRALRLKEITTTRNGSSMAQVRFKLLAVCRAALKSS